MKKLYTGKTKDVYEIESGEFAGEYLLQFKDDACGENGVFDPGANQIGLTIDGKGKAGLQVTEFFFGKINEAGERTHFINCDVEKAQMTVRPATVFGKNGVEVICRYKAFGSFVRRYGQFISEGTPLDALVEITLKDDERGDPLVTKETLAALNILTENEYDVVVSLAKKICGVIKGVLAEKSLELIDIKLEFGKGKDGEVMLIDEVSGDIMRVFKDGKSVTPLELTSLLLG